ncbi:MAG TPA: hypothetical protein VHP81_02650 [Lachnospiraceae bacterium]|nr:hypothetical protein [Lachnospiraceae bacterium]
MKKLIVIVLILLCILTSCSNKADESDDNKLTNAESTIKSNLETLNTFFSSQDGIQALATGWKFTKAYFSADLDTMKKYILGEQLDAYKRENVFHNLMYFNLDWNFCNVISDSEVFLQYSFELENDSLASIYVNLKRIDDEWRITSYELE